jgi:hypothetical protein
MAAGRTLNDRHLIKHNPFPSQTMGENAAWKYSRHPNFRANVCASCEQPDISRFSRELRNCEHESKHRYMERPQRVCGILSVVSEPELSSRYRPGDCLASDDPIVNDRRSVGGMRIGRGNRNICRLLKYITWYKTRSTPVRNWSITA